MRITERRCLQKASEPAAAGRIGLQDINRAALEHSPEIIDIVTVLARCDFHRLRRVLSNQTQTFQIIR